MNCRFRNIKNRGAICYNIMRVPYKILAPYYVIDPMQIKRNLVSHYIKWTSVTFAKNIAKIAYLRPQITL
jgi:hypothetical protein